MFGFSKSFGVWDTYDVMSSEPMTLREIRFKIYEEKGISPSFFRTYASRIMHHLTYLHKNNFVQVEERQVDPKEERFYWSKVIDGKKDTESPKESPCSLESSLGLAFS